MINSQYPQNQTELAESYEITKQTMNNYMRMASMIPELEDLVETGIVTKDTAILSRSTQKNKKMRMPKHPHSLNFCLKHTGR